MDASEKHYPQPSQVDLQRGEEELRQRQKWVDARFNPGEAEERDGKRKGLEEEILGLTKIDEDKTYRYSDPHETFFVVLRSFEQMEEDLAQMPKSEGLLSETRHQEIVKEAYLDVLQTYGQYLNLEILNEVFPGLDVNHPESYNFRDSNFKPFILSRKDYYLYKGAHYPASSDKSGDRIAAEAFGAPQAKNEAPIWGDVLEVNIPPRSVAVINEAPPEITTGDLLPVTRESPAYMKRVEDNLRSRVRHELLHVLGAGQGFTKPIREGIVEYYASISGIERDETPVIGWDESTKFVALLVRFLMNDGMSREEIDKAFVGSSESDLKKIEASFTLKHGKDIKEIVAEFKNFEQGKAVINSLIKESGQDGN